MMEVEGVSPIIHDESRAIDDIYMDEWRSLRGALETYWFVLIILKTLVNTPSESCGEETNYSRKMLEVMETFERLEGSKMWSFRYVCCKGRSISWKFSMVEVYTAFW